MNYEKKKLRYLIKKGDILPPDTEPLIIGYKEPLRPIEGGFGYMGVIAYDKTKTFTQCCICGYFYKNLGIHVKVAHNQTAREYRLEHGLGATTPLTAPKTREKYFEQWANLSKKEKAIKLKNLDNGRKNMREISRRGTETRKKLGKSLHQKNLEGRCPDQLLSKILEMKEELGRTPTRKEFYKKYGGFMGSIQLTFGTWTEALNVLGLQPHTKGRRPQYSEKALLRMLVNFKEQYGREPYSKDLGGGLLPSQYTFQKYFDGSFVKAKQILWGE